MSKELSSRIKELRKIKGYTQKDFASLIGVGQTTVANYESGIRVPDTDKLDKIADLFEVTVDYLLGREDNAETSIMKPKDEAVSVKSVDEYYKVFLNYLISGHREEARMLINTLQKEGINIKTIYLNILGRALKEVGLLWEKGTIDVWKEHFISESVLDIMREVKVKEKKIKGKGYSMLALTSGPEMHNIGLRMITDMLEVHGWKVTYLGSNLPVLSLIKAIEIEKPDVVAVSVTLPYHIESSKYIITAVKNYFGKRAPKIIVGGAAFTNCSDVCRETGADYYGINVEDIKAVVKKGVD